MHASIIPFHKVVASKGIRVLITYDGSNATHSTRYGIMCALTQLSRSQEKLLTCPGILSLDKDDQFAGWRFRLPNTDGRALIETMFDYVGPVPFEVTERRALAELNRQLTYKVQEALVAPEASEMIVVVVTDRMMESFVGDSINGTFDVLIEIHDEDAFTVVSYLSDMGLEGIVGSATQELYEVLTDCRDIHDLGTQYPLPFRDFIRMLRDRPPVKIQWCSPNGVFHDITKVYDSFHVVDFGSLAELRYTDEEGIVPTLPTQSHIFVHFADSPDVHVYEWSETYLSFTLTT